MRLSLFSVVSIHWQNQGAFYSLVAWSLAALVTTAVVSEFLRGAGVIQRHTGKICLPPWCNSRAAIRDGTGATSSIWVWSSSSLGLLDRRSIKVKSRSSTSAKHDAGTLPPRVPQLHPGIEPQLRQRVCSAQCLSGWQKDHATCAREALLRGKPADLDDRCNHSTLAWDLYVVYAGKDPDTGHPIIKVFLNPLVAWI